MSDGTTSNRLPVLAAEIRLAHAGVEAAAKVAGQRAIEAGTALIEAKALLKHGEWLPWLKEHCQISERTAQLYMKIVRLGLNSATVADIGLKAAGSAIAVIHDPFYNPFANCDETGIRDWHVFNHFLVEECNHSTEDACRHTEWLLQKQYRTPCEWLADTRWRARLGMREPSAELKSGWASFLARYQNHSAAEVIALIEANMVDRSCTPPKKRRRA